MNKNIDKIQSQSINSFKYKIYQYMVKIQFFKDIYNIFKLLSNYNQSIYYMGNNFNYFFNTYR